MNELIRNIDGAFEELVLNLSNEVKLYQELSQLLKDKQTSIVNGDVDALQKYVYQEQRLIPKIQAISNKRELYAVKISAVLGTSPTKPSLTDLIHLAPAIYSEKLVFARERLIESIDQIAHANRENDFLLRSSVDLVRGLAHVLLGGNDNENIHYSGLGRIADKRNHRVNVDCQV